MQVGYFLRLHNYMLLRIYKYYDLAIVGQNLGQIFTNSLLVS